jgi:pimeloyl-ACP methyl ester carboxylesterase
VIIFCLHYLGGSAREWGLVEERLPSHVRLVAIDLPGFGDAAEKPGYSVAEMATYVASTIRAARPERWLLAGHSMGAKVAAAIARRAQDDATLGGLCGLLFVAGSPPSPEPMPDDQRATMLGWFASDTRASEAQARDYVASNSGEHIAPDSAQRAREDVLRANRAAWVAWLESGSREDWSERIGVLQTPAIVLAGADDTNLGPDAQQRLLLPHLADARLVTVPEASHLLPLEAPDLVARSIVELAYRALIDSPRVSSGTREALLARAQPEDETYVPQALDAHAFATLRAVVRRIVPQRGPSAIDLGARIDRQLGDGTGDGWRFAVLPPDAAAYAAGLATLDDAATRAHRAAFADLAVSQQDALLERVAAGTLGSDDGTHGEGATPEHLSRDQMTKWFEDLRADAVKAYLLHPLTLARIGYSGIAYGGDGLPKSGFAHVGVGQREVWEPVALAQPSALPEPV